MLAFFLINEEEEDLSSSFCGICVTSYISIAIVSRNRLLVALYLAINLACSIAQILILFTTLREFCEESAGLHFKDVSF